VTDRIRKLAADIVHGARAPKTMKALSVPDDVKIANDFAA
jgi:hypothetical protein